MMQRREGIYLELRHGRRSKKQQILAVAGEVSVAGRGSWGEEQVGEAREQGI
jgi:hypothetical protein